MLIKKYLNKHVKVWIFLCPSLCQLFSTVCYLYSHGSKKQSQAWRCSPWCYPTFPPCILPTSTFARLTPLIFLWPSSENGHVLPCVGTLAACSSQARVRLPASASGRGLCKCFLSLQLCLDTLPTVAHLFWGEILQTFWKECQSYLSANIFSLWAVATPMNGNRKICCRDGVT